MEGSASKEKTIVGEKDGHARSRLHRRPRNLDVDLAELPGQSALKTPQRCGHSSNAKYDGLSREPPSQLGN